MIADVLLNCSGHKLTQRAMTELALRFGRIEDVPIPTISFDADVELQIEAIVRNIRTPLDGTVTLAMIAPGQATVAVLLLVYLNGVVGYFPTLCYLAAEQAGDYMPRATFVIDPQKLRDHGRRFRQTEWQSDQKRDPAETLRPANSR